MVKSPCCFLQRTQVQFPESTSESSQLPVTPQPGDLILISVLHVYRHALGAHTNTHTHTHTHSFFFFTIAHIGDLLCSYMTADTA